MPIPQPKPPLQDIAVPGVPPAAAGLPAGAVPPQTAANQAIPVPVAGVPPELLNPNISPEQLAEMNTAGKVSEGRVWSKNFVIILIVVVVILAIAGYTLFRVFGVSDGDESDTTEAGLQLLWMTNC